MITCLHALVVLPPDDLPARFASHTPLPNGLVPSSSDARELSPSALIHGSGVTNSNSNNIIAEEDQSFENGNDAELGLAHQPARVPVNVPSMASLITIPQPLMELIEKVSRATSLGIHTLFDALVSGCMLLANGGGNPTLTLDLDLVSRDGTFQALRALVCQKNEMACQKDHHPTVILEHYRKHFQMALKLKQQEANASENEKKYKVILRLKNVLLDGLRKKIQDMEITGQDLITVISGLQEEIAEAREAHRREISAFAAFAAEDLAQTKEVYEKKISHLEIKLKIIDSHHNSELIKLDEEVEKQWDLLKKKDNEIGNLQILINKETEASKILYNKLDQKESKIQSLKVKVDEQDARLAELKIELANSQQAQEAGEKKSCATIVALQEHLQQKEDKLSELVEENKTLSSSYEVKLQALENELAATKQAQEDAEKISAAKVLDLQKQLQEKDAKFKELEDGDRKQPCGHEAEIEKWKKKAQVAETKFKVVSKQKQELNLTNKEIVDTINGHLDEKLALSEENASLKSAGKKLADRAQTIRKGYEDEIEKINKKADFERAGFEDLKNQAQQEMARLTHEVLNFQKKEQVLTKMLHDPSIRENLTWETCAVFLRPYVEHSIANQEEAIKARAESAEWQNRIKAVLCVYEENANMMTLAQQNEAKLRQEVAMLHSENAKLRFQVDAFESFRVNVQKELLVWEAVSNGICNFGDLTNIQKPMKKVKSIMTLVAWFSWCFNLYVQLREDHADLQKKCDRLEDELGLYQIHEEARVSDVRELELKVRQGEENIEMLQQMIQNMRMVMDMHQNPPQYPAAHNLTTYGQELVKENQKLRERTANVEKAFRENNDHLRRELRRWQDYVTPITKARDDAKVKAARAFKEAQLQIDTWRTAYYKMENDYFNKAVYRMKELMQELKEARKELGKPYDPRFDDDLIAQDPQAHPSILTFDGTMGVAFEAFKALYPLGWTVFIRAGKINMGPKFQFSTPEEQKKHEEALKWVEVYREQMKAPEAGSSLQITEDGETPPPVAESSQEMSVMSVMSDDGQSELTIRATETKVNGQYARLVEIDDDTETSTVVPAVQEENSERPAMPSFLSKLRARTEKLEDHIDQARMNGGFNEEGDALLSSMSRRKEIVVDGKGKGKTNEQ